MSLGPLKSVPLEPVAKRQLRIALAMRGGVSLAVWIGGACSEIDALRVSAPANGDEGSPGMYSRLLALAGYNGVALDVISGASAGGLNGSLMSTSLMYGVPFEVMKPLWISVADIGALLRSPYDREPISILKGDEYFLRELHLRLEKLIGSKTLKGERLDLFLAATLMKPVRTEIQEDWADAYSETSQAAHFHLRHNVFSSDFEGVNVDTISYRLALAARASSSFPAAFEPACIATKRPTVIGKRGSEPKHNMFGMFSVTSPEGYAYVMDGGVLDNIPVARAIQAIGEAKADGPTERWLLFLHPSPEVAQPPPPEIKADKKAEDRPNAPDTALRALGTSAGRESVLDDVAVLRDHNDVANRYQALRNTFFEQYLAVDPGSQGPPTDTDIIGALMEDAERSYDRYVGLRSSFAAGYIRQLLESPVQSLNEDPFTEHRFTAPLSSGDHKWTQRERLQLEGSLRQAWATSLPDSAPLSGDPAELRKLDIPALQRGIDTLIGLLRRIESLDIDEQRERFGQIKVKAYAVKAATDLLNHMTDLFWPVYACISVPSVDTTVGWGATAVAARVEITNQWISPPPPANPADKMALLFAHLVDELKRRMARVDLTPDTSSPSAPMPPIAGLWGALISSLRETATEWQEVGDQELPDESADLKVFIAALNWIADAKVDKTGRPADPMKRACQAVAALEILAFPLEMTALGGKQYIRYLRISGAAKTPLERHFPGGRLSLEDKLAGNELANFAAFYKRSWRANDWMWGHLDAATSLIHMLVQPEGLRAHTSESDLFKAVKNLCTGSLPNQPQVPDVNGRPVAAKRDNPDPWTEHFEQLWLSHESKVWDEINRLFSTGPRQPLKTDLAQTKEALIERRHWELVAEQLPDVVCEAAGAEFADAVSVKSQKPIPDRWNKSQQQRLKRDSLMQRYFALKTKFDQPLAHPQGITCLLDAYNIGRETILDDRGSDRFTLLSTDAMVVTWSALTAKPSLKFLKPVGWILRLIRLLAQSIVRTPRWAVAMFLSVIFLCVLVIAGDHNVLGLGRLTASVVLLVTLALLFYFGRLWLRLTLIIGLILLVLLLALQIDGTLTIYFGDRPPTGKSLDGRYLIVLIGAGVLSFLASKLFRKKDLKREAEQAKENPPGCADDSGAGTERDVSFTG